MQLHLLVFASAHVHDHVQGCVIRGSVLLQVQVENWTRLMTDGSQERKYHRYWRVFSALLSASQITDAAHETCSDESR